MKVVRLLLIDVWFNAFSQLLPDFLPSRLSSYRPVIRSARRGLLFGVLIICPDAPETNVAYEYTTTRSVVVVLFI